MSRHGAAFVIALASALLAGCAGDVDYIQQRGFDSDISASLNHGPTAARPGETPQGEPVGALPWTIGESRQ